MTDRLRVSVCMATYNGSDFIVPQINSILAELDSDDEIVVVDDASSDDTVAKIDAYGDPRIKVIRQAHNSGYVRAFERALAEANGDVIFLSDQDDVWVPGRRQLLLVGLTHGSVAASNISVLGSGAALRNPLTGRPWRLSPRTSRQSVRNELRILVGVAPYYGCAMALNRSALAHTLPFPPFLKTSHDLWIATVANADRSMIHVEATTLLRRIHESNASPSRPRALPEVLRSRVMLLRCWWEARRRVRQTHGTRRVG